MKRSFLTALWDRLGGGSETATPGPSERLRLSGKVLNARQIPHHHVVFSARQDRVGLRIRAGGEMVPHVYPAEPVLGWLNQQAR